MDNWVERRFRKENNLTQAEELWQAVVTAIHNACTSFSAHYAELAGVQLSPQNGHRLRITVTYTSNRPMVYQNQNQTIVQIAFDPNKPCITVTAGGNPVKEFLIEADENHCFLKVSGSEVSPDECSKRALEDVLFKQSSLGNNSGRSSPGGPTSWMG